MDNKNLHKSFKLDGISFKNEKELLFFTQNNYTELFQFLNVWFDNSEFISVNTSGSTGKPKTIKLKKEFMVNSAKATGEFFELNSGTTALLCLPIQFIAGKMMLVRAMILGWYIDVVESNSNPLKFIKKEYDFSAMVPLQLFNSIEKLFRIKTLIVGGGVVSNKLQLAIKSLPTKVYATYGMTETITHIAIKPLNKASGYSLKSDVYQTLPNVKLNKDNRGCLLIDASKISDKVLITNDIVNLISETSFIWLGRYDNIINSGGVKLIPEQIETKLSQIISQRFFVTGVPDKLLGEKLVLIIEGTSFNFDENIFRSILSKFEIPKEVFFVNNFTLTKTDKIDRKKTLKLLRLDFKE